MADLYLMCGIPGSGKSTWLEKHVKLDERNKIVSRDEVRFSLLKPNEPYFSKEKEVYKKFWETINHYLSLGYNVFADQTSLTKKSRKYLIDNVNGYDHVNAIWMATPLEISLERNNLRTGRAFVPPETIKDMYHSFTTPSLNEGFTNVYIIKEDKIFRLNKVGDNK